MRTDAMVPLCFCTFGHPLEEMECEATDTTGAGVSQARLQELGEAEESFRQLGKIIEELLELKKRQKTLNEQVWYSSLHNNTH